MVYYPQTDRQMERTNQKLEQYLRIYVNHMQNNWLEWLATTEFVFNNKVYTVTKSSSFKVNYRRKLRMSFDIRKKRKYVKIEEFVKKIKNRHKEMKTVLIKLQKEMKKYVERNRKKAGEYKVGDKVLINTKNFSIELMKRTIKKLIEKYIRSYMVKKIISENMVELELLTTLRIYLVVNVKRIVKYQNQVEEQKKISLSLVEIEEEKKYEIEKILNR